jgi:hypothetical protein
MSISVVTGMRENSENLFSQSAQSCDPFRVMMLFRSTGVPADRFFDMDLDAPGPAMKRTTQQYTQSIAIFNPRGIDSVG